MNWNPPLAVGPMLLIVLGAMVLVALSYLPSRQHLNPFSPRGMVTVALRLTAMLLLLFFLLQPTRLPDPQRIESKRSVAVLIDASASMSRPATGISATPTRLDAGRAALESQRLLTALNEKVRLSAYTFDSQVAAIKTEAMATLRAQGRATDIAAALEQVTRGHQDQDLAGIILISDGRVTQGGDPRKTAKDGGVPIHAVVIGEEPKATSTATTQPADLAIDSVSAEPRVILGRTARVVVSVSAIGMPARQTSVELTDAGKVIQSGAVALSPQQPRRTAVFMVQPTRVGVHTYEARVPMDPSDVNPANNRVSFTIEVVDPVNRLVYVDRLRDERRFIRPVLASQKNIKYTAIVQQDEKRVLVDGNDVAMKRDAATFSAEQLRGIKAVILGDLASNALSSTQTAALIDWVDKGGALLVLSGPANMGEKGLASAALASVLPVTVAAPAAYIEQECRVELTPEGAAHPAFQKVKGTWGAAAPLLSRFSVTGIKPAATALLATREEGAAPIVASHSFGHGKVAIVLTDSTWRWQLGFKPIEGAVEISEHALFWRQMIDWLLPDLEQGAAEASQVQLITDRAEYEVNDKVTLLAVVRAADGSVPRQATVEFTIATPDGRPIRRTGTLDAPSGTPGTSGTPSFSAGFDALLAGSYDVQVVARDGSATLGSDRATIKVVQPTIELTRTDPDRALMEEIAKLSGGKVVAMEALGTLADLAEFAPREAWVQPNAEKDAVPAWNRWWLLAIFLVLTSAEWAVRRKNQWV